MKEKEAWKWISGFNNTEVIGDFDEAVSVSNSGRIHTGIHLRKNEMTLLEKMWSSLLRYFVIQWKEEVDKNSVFCSFLNC